MTTSTGNTESGGDLQKGNSCLLTAMGQHFLVEVLDIGQERVRVSFPGSDYPVQGMMVDLEFHDKSGFNRYRAEIIAGPQETEDEGIVLSLPRAASRSQHRDSCRVPTDLTVQLKSAERPRWFTGSLLNISAGGALVETEATFGIGATAQLMLSLPGEPNRELVTEVVHVNDAVEKRRDDERHVVGLRFVSPDRTVAESLTRYIWKRLRDLYAEE
jgi:c-di-GMP-binding flagellar brake protein YcgR